MERKKKILIADDESQIHNLLTRALSGDEFDVSHAYDGRETLRLAQEQVPDLIVLDLMMPLMDGRDICKKLKSDPGTRNIKIIILTGKDEQHDRIVGLELEADDYVTKPVSLSYMARKISRLLEKE